MIPLLTFFAGSLLATLILGVFSSRAYSRGWRDRGAQIEVDELERLWRVS